MQTVSNDIRVRWVGDLEPNRVLEISRASFGTDAITKKQLESFLSSPDHIPKVIAVDGVVVGYNLHTLDKGYVTIRELAVHPDYRRSGFGSYLLLSLQRQLPELRRYAVSVELTESNLEAQLFFRKNGFKYRRTKQQHGCPDKYVFIHSTYSKHYTEGQ